MGPIHQGDILTIVAGASFASGLNVYATVATLGLLSHLGFFQLPPALHALNSWPVIIIAGALFTAEFFADKIPLFDLLWNALHTFIRVPIAALLAYGATQNLSPATQLFATLLGGAIALAAHGGKMAVRSAVTPSPEPFSNIGLSLGEDALAVSLTWLATQHPIITSAIVAVLLLAIAVAIRIVFRAFKRLFRRATARPAPAV
ncbi:MAG TPA: DUF4126 domain-containing protein [Candidatus Angelobacter sp.]|nr:DUF4126 domain-containing protein [Candidatus Angelobacter sp.]